MLHSHGGIEGPDIVDGVRQGINHSEWRVGEEGRNRTRGPKITSLLGGEF